MSVQQRIILGPVAAGLIEDVRYNRPIALDETIQKLQADSTAYKSLRDIPPDSNDAADEPDNIATGQQNDELMETVQVLTEAVEALDQAIHKQSATLMNALLSLARQQSEHIDVVRKEGISTRRLLGLLATEDAEEYQGVLEHINDVIHHMRQELPEANEMSLAGQNRDEDEAERAFRFEREQGTGAEMQPEKEEEYER